MINKWDGKSLVLNEASGSILASQIAAGKKNDDNTFSGVLMGDWSPNGESISDNSISGQCGIYGFHQGEQSFALREDGTAFFGKDGKGRIILDGNQCLLKSATYDITNGNGMLLNLESNLLDCKIKGSSVFTINSGANSTNYLTIRDPVGYDTLMNVGNNSYYLQSKNYADNGKIGMKIDLNNGYVWANTGTFNGDIYIKYKNGRLSWFDNNDTTSLNSILTYLQTTAEDAKEAANAAASAAQQAQSAASQAQSAINGLASKLDSYRSGYGGIEYSYIGSSGSGSTRGIQMYAANGGYVAASNSGASIYYYGNQIYVTGSGCFSSEEISVKSDKRLKTNISYNHINDYKKLFSELKPVSYKYKLSDRTYLGFIAQDVENILQENNLNDNSLIKKDEKQLLSLNYNSLFTLNIAVTQDLMKEIEELKLQVKELKEEKTNE